MPGQVDLLLGSISQEGLRNPLIPGVGIRRTRIGEHEKGRPKAAPTAPEADAVTEW
jgi:hypothetical protein